jgi:hypothetical protein
MLLLEHTAEARFQARSKGILVSSGSTLAKNKKNLFIRIRNH